MTKFNEAPEVEEESDLDDDIAEIKAMLKEMKEKALKALKYNPTKPEELEEVIQLKKENAALVKENVSLKKENADLKQQIKDLWNSFSSFCEKHATTLSNKWNAFFKNAPKVAQDKDLAKTSENSQTASCN